MPHKNLKDHTGQKFGRWTVLSRAKKDKRGRAQWLCLCECGEEKVVLWDNLRRGKSRSCGCLSRDVQTIHGFANHPLSMVWYGMVDRCTNSKSRSWPNYGGRGIGVCPRWSGKDGLANFISDMFPSYKPGLSLDRIRNDLGYSPDNCRWATQKQQARNTRVNRLITYKGKTQCLAAWAEELGLNPMTLSSRLDNYGWTLERALTSILP